MNKTFALLGLGALPSVASASDFTGAYPLMLMQVTLLVWPLVLPLFYLGPRRNKLHSYFLFAVLTYGSLGIAGIPEAFYTNIASWFPYDERSHSWILPIALAKHSIAFIFCLWYLPRFRSLLRESRSAPQ